MPNRFPTNFSPNFGVDLHELRAALIDRCVELTDYALGIPQNKAHSSRREARYGNHGSFSIALRGKNKGLWYDHEAEEGGDVFELIQYRILGRRDFVEAIKWAREWLGWPADGPPPILTVADERRRQIADQKAQQDEEEEKERQRRIAKAKVIWDRSRPIDGTAAEIYLREERKIKEKLWPSVLRFDDLEHALVMKVTTEVGEFVGVQIVRLTLAGKKIAADSHKRQKQSYGLIGSGAVRLPSRFPNGPLCLAEGPETGLSIWYATGLETSIALGSIGKLEPSKGRKIVVCRDDDERHALSRRSLTAKIAEWRKDGFDVAEVYPWSRRRYKKGDFNDALKEGGVGAVHDRINLVLREVKHDTEFFSVHEARALLDEKVRNFFSTAHQKKNVTHAIDVSLGAGKTETALRHAIVNLHAIRAEGDKRVLVIAVPEHRVGAEIKNRLEAMAEARGLQVAVWRGREANTPDSDGQMCGDIETVREAQAYMAEIRKEVCGECPFQYSCAYLKQEEVVADIWIVAHVMLFHEAIEPIKRCGIFALIVDESPWISGLIGVGGQKMTIPLDALDSGVMPIPDGDGIMGGTRLTDLRSRVKRALINEPEGPVRRGALIELGLEAQSGADGVRMEYARKVSSGHWKTRRDNRTIYPMVRVFEAVREILRPFGPQQSGWLEIGRDADGARVLVIRGRREIAADFRVPTLLLDATFDIELVRPYWQGAELTGKILVATPHQSVFQTTGRTFGKSVLQAQDSRPGNKRDTKEKHRGHSALRKVSAFVQRVDRETGGRTLVIGNKNVVASLSLPSHIARAHFNAIAGRDEWREISALIVLGRTQPPPKAVEDIAAALTGAAPLRLDGWYSGADVSYLRKSLASDGVQVVLGETDTHPDPMCERIRARIADGEVMQAIGRGRGVNRSTDNPLLVFVLNDVPLPIPVDETLPESLVFEPTPEDRMLAEGGVAFEDGAAAALAYPSLWKSPEAARTATHRASSVTFPYNKSLIGECNAASRIRAAIYQRRGDGQRRGTARIDMLIVSDPEAELTRLLGPLSFFELLPATDAPDVAACAANYDALRLFCCARMAELYLDSPIPMASSENEVEMLAAFAAFHNDPTAKAVTSEFRRAWQSVFDEWDTEVVAAADRLWEERNPERAKARIRRAMALFDAHTELQIRYPTELTEKEWQQVKSDSCGFMRDYVTDAIEQNWSVESLYALPASGRTGLIYFLHGEEIAEFSADVVFTASGRQFNNSLL